MTWGRRAAGLSAVVVVAGLGVSSVPAVAGAEDQPNINTGTDSSLGGWTVTADANTVDLLADSPSGLAGEHPIDEVDFPEAYTDFESGPFGVGRATLLYPGSVVANFGSASGQLNMGIPPQLQPIVGSMNDPVIATSAYPGGPATSTWPSANPTQGQVGEMTTSAGDNGEIAASSLQNTSLNGLVDVKQVRSTSSSVATSTATATATTSVGDVQILGGLIDIKGLEATASATSNGKKASGSGDVSPVTVTIAGTPVGVDAKGIELGPAPTQPLGGLLSRTASLNKLISALGLEIVPLGVTKTVQGGNAQVTAGGLQVTFTAPAAPAQLSSLLDNVFSQLPSQLQVLGTLPQVLQQATMTFTVGRATATADASPPFDLVLPPLPPASSFPAGTTPAIVGSAPTSPGAGLAVPATGGDLGGGGVTAPSSGSGGSGPAATPATTAASTPRVASPSSPTTVAPAAGPPPSSLTSAVPISLSTPVGAGIVVALLAAAGVVAYGLRRLAGLLTAAPAGTACPNQEEQP